MEIEINTDIEGGNVIVDRIEGDSIYLKTNRRDSSQHWFYWRFRIRGAASRTLNFIFDSSEGLCLSSRGPAISTDGGENWHWLGVENTAMPDAESFTYTFAPDEDSTEMCFCAPYMLRHWQAFCNGLDAAFVRDTLCRSPKERSVPLIKYQKENTSDRPLIIITGRHHCCETSSGYTMEGLVKAWKDTCAPIADLIVIPFVDLDGVEAGDQGKFRKPHDHNRDYNDQPLYPEVAAIMSLIRESTQPFIALDLHCPYARGNDSETLYRVGNPDAANEEAAEHFCEILEEESKGLPYKRSNDIPFGTAWNVEENYKKGKSFAAYCINQTHCTLASTMEIPYANAQGVEVNPQNLRSFGRSLAHSLARYLA
jgi:hypothetical protein